jgi:N-acetyl sugar amidotransferase
VIHVKRCLTCCIPDTRPSTEFIDGQCTACVNYRKRADIDWKSREAELLHILATAPKNDSGYDCVVASSGGKDSHYQVLRLIELGARPLVVTASTCMLTEVGRCNIDNLSRYATTIEVTPNRRIRAKLNRLGLELVGDVSLPEHMAIFSIPFRVAADLGIPTIWYGEAPLFEYGSPVGHEQARTMTRRWTFEHGGFLGLKPQDFIGVEGITANDMADYMLPDDSRLQNVTAYWLGQYEPWDSHRNMRRAHDAGIIQAVPCPANLWHGENVDCALTGLHDHSAYRKYGLGRLCVQASVDIRMNRLTRERAMEMIEESDGLFPWMYMNVMLDDVEKYLGMTHKQLMAALDKHTDWDLFSKVEGGRPILKEFAWDSQPA